MADARRIVILDGNDCVIKAIDISDLDNADTEFRLQLAVETRCDQLHWHRGQVTKLVPWGRRIGQ